ncbi:tRNA pseudouridine(55) synthase TruB [Leptolyngbya sp. PCC 6406]|uniref:tRNA pseudouridine(55) synthase TruB n=1 Tax=Leptolyngbya sp. PCC 6406 TaxID=1173264 RepID=UPI0039647531
MTSHDCVARVRRLLGTKKVGHGGTLDPAASGVLPIALGRATRLLPFLPEDKAYRAVIRFGLTTTTDDLEGDPIATMPVPTLTREAAIAPLPQFVGTLDQVPPRYSAIQVQGQRLYDLARRGETVNVPHRTVTVHQVQVLDWQPGEFPELTVAVACGSGTYIRAIARDWGAVLGVGATLAALVRTHSSGFTLGESLSFEDLETAMAKGRSEAIAAETFAPIPPDVALAHLPRLTLPPALALRWRQGQKLPLTAEQWQDDRGDLAVILDEAAEFLGVSAIAPSDLDHPRRLIPKMVFTPAG